MYKYRNIIFLYRNINICINTDIIFFNILLIFINPWRLEEPAEAACAVSLCASGIRRGHGPRTVGGLTSPLKVKV